MKCLGAKVNGKLVPISYVLANGDQIDILTSNNQNLKLTGWTLVTSKAKAKIKAALNSHKSEMVEEGKEILQRKMRHAKIAYTDDEINKLKSSLIIKHLRSYS
jgi:GTP pyrophosphokinase